MGPRDRWGELEFSTVVDIHKRTDSKETEEKEANRNWRRILYGEKWEGSRWDKDISRAANMGVGQEGGY